MNTGVTSLAKIPELTAVYPFHGAEILLLDWHRRVLPLSSSSASS